MLEQSITRLIIFSDEAWFHLQGHVSSQSNRYYATEKPNFVHETPLHYQKIGVWCAINGYRIIGPIFYDGTINAERYRNNILAPFFEQLKDTEFVGLDISSRTLPPRIQLISH